MKVKLFEKFLNLLMIFSINFLMSITGFFMSFFICLLKLALVIVMFFIKINQNMGHIVDQNLLQKLVSFNFSCLQSFNVILLKMSTKILVMQLGKHTAIKFPEYDAKFYSNRRNFYIDMGLDKSLFSFENYHKLLNKVDCFLNEYLGKKLFLYFYQS